MLGEIGHLALDLPDIRLMVLHSLQLDELVADEDYDARGSRQ